MENNIDFLNYQLYTVQIAWKDNYKIDFDLFIIVL